MFRRTKKLAPTPVAALMILHLRLTGSSGSEVDDTAWHHVFGEALDKDCILDTEVKSVCYS